MLSVTLPPKGIWLGSSLVQKTAPKGAHWSVRAVCDGDHSPGTPCTVKGDKKEPQRQEPGLGRQKKEAELI